MATTLYRGVWSTRGRLTGSLSASLSFRSLAPSLTNIVISQTGHPSPHPSSNPSSFCQRSFSTADEAPSLQGRTTSKLALGGHKWSQLGPSYGDLIETAIANGITTIEVGQGPAADEALFNILSKVGDDQKQVRLLKRIGYRTAQAQEFLPGDVQVEQMMSPPTDSAGNSKNDSPESKDDVSSSSSSTEPEKPKVSTVVHNLGPHSIQQALDQTPLQSNLVLMLHNPEVQSTLHTEATNKDADRQGSIRKALVESFVACEEQIAQDASKMTAYGIVSNGLSLPGDHPLHLSWKDAILPALQEAYDQLQTPLHFSVIALPLNLLERSGLPVAHEIREDLASHPRLFATAPEIHALRPLTAYPDQGTGTEGHAFVLADYKVPATMKKELMWTHELGDAPPQVYQVALQQAMAHFDATEILQAAQDGQELTTEQRETLDGCKLLQSLLHDVDNGLEKVRSFSLHEEFLSGKIIPLIYDTFESYDDDTANVLRSFFAAYSLAVRHAIARNTRTLLKEGESANAATALPTPTYPDLPDTMRLQEYALRFLLSEKSEATGKALIDKIIIGCNEPDHILEDLEIVYQALTEEEEVQAAST